MLQLPKLATPVRLRSPAPFNSYSGSGMLNKFIFTAVMLFTALFFCGCRNLDNRMPSEDLEVPQKFHDIITILKDPHLSSNSQEKYEAVKDLIKSVDLSFTREIKTVNDMLYHGDAAIDSPSAEQRTVVFNYQYKDDYVRLIFVTMRNFVLRVSIVCTEDSMRKYETDDAVKMRGTRVRK